MTNSAFRFGEERGAKRCFGETKINLDPSAAAFHFAGRGGFERDAKIVQTARTGKPDVNRGVKNVFTIAQQLFHVFEGEALQKILGRNAGPGRKQPMKMKRTQGGGISKRAQIGLLGVMSIQEPDHTCDSFVIIHNGSLSSASRRDHPLLATILQNGFQSASQLVRTSRPSSRARASFASESS